jgi:hypothetical protein
VAANGGFAAIACRAGSRTCPGQALPGTWTVVPPSSPSTYGYFDLPAVGSFNSGVESEKTAWVHLFRPLPDGWSHLSDRPWT